MMKKVLFGVAMALLASVSVGTLQSCKDDVSDLKTQTSFDLVKLQQDLNNTETELRRLITNNANNITAVIGLLKDYATVQYVNGEIAKLNTALKSTIGEVQANQQKNYIELKGDIITANGRISKLETTQAQMLNMIRGALNEISWLKNKDSQQDTAISSLQTAVNDLKGSVSALETAIAGCVKNEDFQILVGRVDANKAEIDLINDAINGLRSDLVDINNQIGDINNQLGANSESIENLKYKMMLLKKEVSQLKEELNDVKNDVNTLKTDLNNLTTKVDNLSKKLDYLTNQVNQLVTGILIQGVNSPVFGDFSLPLGVKSNIIFNWYGKNIHGADIAFPSARKAFSGIQEDPAADFDGAPFFTIPANYYPQKDTLGTVYVTLNPIGSRLSSDTVTVVNSVGDKLPFKVVLKKSNKELKFGLSRAEEEEEEEYAKIESNLYEGNVVLDPTNDVDRERIEVTIDKNLASSLKNALKDPSKSTAVALLKALYDQMSDQLYAYALSYGWNVDAGDTGFSSKAYSVLSQYDLAVATAKPLSYSTLRGEGTSKQLPIIGEIENIISKLENKINITIKPVELENFNINLKDLGVSVATDDVSLLIVIPDIQMVPKNSTDNIPEPTTLVLCTQDKSKFNWEKELESYGGYDPDNKYYEYSQITGMAALGDSITSGIDRALEKAGQRMNAELKKEMQKQINEKVIANLQSQINTQIKDLISDLGDEFQPYFNKANRAFELYNKIARKVNKFLKNPNAYFQVTALYSMGNNDYGFVSGNPNDWSVYKGNSDFSIFLTSYTGELVVPAYKKYVAITGKRAADGSYTKIKVNNTKYNTGDLNTILDGNRIRVTVPAQKLDKGVYEFTYQAVDYNGWTSTKKFYIEIDK